MAERNPDEQDYPFDPPSGAPGLLPAPSPAESSPQAGTDPEELDIPVEGEGWRCLLFQSGMHALEEMVLQIVLATGCPWQHAEQIGHRVRLHGRAIVVIATRAEAERVAAILRRIELHAAVEPA